MNKLIFRSTYIEITNRRFILPDKMAPRKPIASLQFRSMNHLTCLFLDGLFKLEVERLSLKGGFRPTKTADALEAELLTYLYLHLPKQLVSKLISEVFEMYITITKDTSAGNDIKLSDLLSAKLNVSGLNQIDHDQDVFSVAEYDLISALAETNTGMLRRLPPLSSMFKTLLVSPNASDVVTNLDFQIFSRFGGVANQRVGYEVVTIFKENLKAALWNLNCLTHLSLCNLKGNTHLPSCDDEVMHVICQSSPHLLHLDISRVQGLTRWGLFKLTPDNSENQILHPIQVCIVYLDSALCDCNLLYKEMVSYVGLSQPEIVVHLRLWIHGQRRGSRCNETAKPVLLGIQGNRESRQAHHERQ